MSDNTIYDLMLQGIGMGLSIHSCIAILTNGDKGYIFRVQKAASLCWLVTLLSLYILKYTEDGGPSPNKPIFFISYFIFQYLIEITRFIICYAMYFRNRDVIDPSPLVNKIMWSGAIFTIVTQAAISLFAGTYNFCIWTNASCAKLFDFKTHNLAMQSIFLK